MYAQLQSISPKRDTRAKRFVSKRILNGKNRKIRQLRVSAAETGGVNKVKTGGRRSLLKLLLMATLKRKAFSHGKPPGNDRAAKLPVRSAKAMAPNRVGTQDRKTYLHVE